MNLVCNNVRADVVVFSFPCVFNVCGQVYILKETFTKVEYEDSPPECISRLKQWLSK